VRLNLSKQKGKEKRGSTADAVSSPPVVLSLYSFFSVCKGEVCIWTAREIEMLHAVFSSVHNKGGASHFFFSNCYAASLRSSQSAGAESVVSPFVVRGVLLCSVQEKA
jgi:hypothetical protein